MSKIWQVDVSYTDFDNYQLIRVGLFTEKEMADKCKEKWEKFHEEYKYLLDEPENWDATKDKWYPTNEFDIETFEWFESYEYEFLLMKYGKLRDFGKVMITELDLNKDIFSQQISYKGFSPTNDFRRIIKEFERDYKINSLGI